MLVRLATIALWTAASAAPVAAPPRRAESKDWVVEAHPTGRFVQGKPAKLEVLVGTRAGFHLNDDYAINFVPTPVEGVEFAKVKFEGDGLVQRRCPGDSIHRCAAKLTISFKALTAGKVRVGGTLSFGTCNADTCLIEQVEVAATIAVPSR